MDLIHVYKLGTESNGKYFKSYIQIQICCIGYF